MRNIEKAGLYSEPKFNNNIYYLGEGEITVQTEFIKYIASKILRENDNDNKKFNSIKERICKMNGSNCLWNLKKN